MKKLDFCKDFMLDGYGLSCIENYLLYIFNVEMLPYQYLFFESSLSANEITKAFIDDGISFANFDKIRRLQSIASDYGFIDITYDSVINKEIFDCHDYICIKVKPEYIKEKYNTTLWRDDHYILVSKIEDNKFSYLNDTPRDIGIFSLEELCETFAGKVIAFDIKRDINYRIKENFAELLIEDLKNNTNEIIFANKNIDRYNCIAARNIIGVCRILRKRLCEFCSVYININVEFMIPYIKWLDKCYVQVEYMRLRNKYNPEEIKNMLYRLSENDSGLLAEVRKHIERKMINNER